MQRMPGDCTGSVLVDSHNENNNNNSDEKGRGHLNHLEENLTSSPARYYQLAVVKNHGKFFNFAQNQHLCFDFLAKRN